MVRSIVYLAFSYIRYYKKQTAALFFGVMLSAALLSGMGSLFLSGKNAAAQKARAEYGDWHYSMRGDRPWMEEFQKDPEGDGYKIENMGLETVRKMIEEPFSIQFVYADQGYLDMMGRKLAEGHYPVKRNEVAMDVQTLANLGVSPKLGSQVTLDGETFSLCGILSEMPGKLPGLMGDYSQVFISGTLDYGKNGTFFYVKFQESRDVYRQLWKFGQRYGIALEDITRNNGLYDYVDLAGPVNVVQVIKAGISNKGYGPTYIWSQLNATGQLTNAVILAAAALFGAFVLYSLFQVSVIRRMAQYSVMQALGMTDGYNMAVLLAELGFVCLAGYPAGCIAGNLAAWLVYQKAGRIFIARNGSIHSGVQQVQDAFVFDLPDAGDYLINWAVAWKGMAALACVIVVISMVLMKKMRRLTVRQMMAKEISKRPCRKIYSIRHANLTGILTRKFMFARKGTFIGILLSLSVGSIIFLGAFYVTENTKRNNELLFKADDGLGSDIQVYTQSGQPADVIPESAVMQMQEVSGIQKFHPVRYQLGEIFLKDGTYLWTQYFGGLNPDDAAIMENYNGIVTKAGKDDYKIKVNIYGYDDAMLEELSAYLLDGEIDPEKMRKENTVIIKPLMDGQGNYGGIDIHPGSELELTAAIGTDVPGEALRFQGESGWYKTEKLPVSALVTRPLAKVDSFIGDDGTSYIDIIMTNEQMELHFGVSDYRTVSISVEDGASALEVSRNLDKITAGIGKCVVRDYSRQIQAQNLYLTQKMFFYYGIAAVLLGISLLHIMNSMQYLVVARKREFGILRAMGITDWGFCKMMAKEGLRYGAYSVLAVIVLYLPVQKILYYFMVHVYLYLHPEWFISWEALAGTAVLNMAVCVMVTLLSGRTVLRRQIMEEIRE